MTRNPITHQLTRDEWSSLIKRALLFASQLHRKYLLSVKGAPEPEDLVQDAVAAYLTGTRKIPEDIPLFSGLCGIITSKVSHFHSQAYTSKRGQFNDLEIHASEKYQDSLLEYTELRDVLIDSLGNDRQLNTILYLLWEDPDRKPRDLADLTNTPIETIYNQLRRLRYKLQGVRAVLDR